MTASNIPMPLSDVPAVALAGPPRTVGDPGLANPEGGVDWHSVWRALLRSKRLIAWDRGSPGAGSGGGGDGAVLHARIGERSRL
jgi:hypothetical protein